MDVLRDQWWGHGLLTAASEGDIDEIRRVLVRLTEPEHSPLDFAQPATPLIFDEELTQQKADEQEMAILRLRRAAINYKNEDGFTAVHMAVQGGRFETLRYLVNHGADINAQTVYGRTALHIALAEGSLSLVAECMRLKADPAIPNANGYTVCQTAKVEARGNTTIITDIERALSETARLHGETMRRLRKQHAVAQHEMNAQEADRDQEQQKIEGWEERISEINAREARDGRLPAMVREERARLQGQLAVSYALLENMEQELARKTKATRDIENEIEDIETEHQELTRPMENRAADTRHRNAFLEDVIELIEGWDQHNGSFPGTLSVLPISPVPVRSPASASEADDPDVPPAEAAERARIREELSQSFAAADVGGKGWLTQSEFETAYRAWEGGMADTAPPSADPLRACRDILEHSGALRDGKIRMDEFAVVMLRLVQL